MKKKIIVIVEDDLLQAKTAQITIESEDRLKDFECKKYLSYESAMKNFEVLTQATIIIMDIDLSGTRGRIINPTAEGITLANNIHKESPNVPIIYTTAYGRDFYPQIGDNELLDKPIIGEALITRILLVLERKQHKENVKKTNIYNSYIEFGNETKKGIIEKHQILIKEILIATAADSTIYIYTKDKKYVSTSGIRSIIDLVIASKDSGILQIGRGIAVNSRYFIRYEINKNKVVTLFFNTGVSLDLDLPMSNETLKRLENLKKTH